MSIDAIKDMISDKVAKANFEHVIKFNCGDEPSDASGDDAGVDQDVEIGRDTGRGCPMLDGMEELEGRSLKLRALYEHMPAPLLALLGRNADRDNNPNRQIMRAGNCGISAMEGPKVPLYLLGAKLHGLTSISPLYSGCGLMFSATSYCDQIGLTFTSDRDLMPEPRVMRDCIDEAVMQLKKQLKKQLKNMLRKPRKISA